MWCTCAEPERSDARPPAAAAPIDTEQRVVQRPQQRLVVTPIADAFAAMLPAGTAGAADVPLANQTAEPVLPADRVDSKRR